MCRMFVWSSRRLLFMYAFSRLGARFNYFDLYQHEPFNKTVEPITWAASSENSRRF